MEREKLQRRTIVILLLLLISAGVALATGNQDLNTTGPAQGAPQGEKGCPSCHPKLSDQVPQGHFRTGLEEVKYCLICHSLEGAASAFEWVLHLRHYSLPGFMGDCRSCHWIDEHGTFGLMGVEGWKDIKANRQLAEKMSPYFRSWAGSKYLDDRHGQVGVTCGLCHGTFLPQKPPSSKQCLLCHGSYEYLARKAPIHSPSHAGLPECRQCHRAHEESVLSCNQCHTFTHKVP